MNKLPILSGQKICKVLEMIGYYEDYMTGSHIILRNVYPPYRRISVPCHREIAKGTLRAIIREVGLDLNEFKELVKKCK